MLSYPNAPRVRIRPHVRNRRSGIVAVLSALLLVVLFGFVAMGVDTGRMTLTKTRLQNAVDAAALAAAQEITNAVTEAGANGTAVDISTLVVAQARQVASEIAAANGVWIDPERDVRFGRRSYDAAADRWPITWEAEPYNVVQVIARRDDPDTTQPDGRLRLSFGWAVGMSSVELSARSTAFVEARDLVLVLDYSGSMNDDSTFTAFNSLGQQAVEQNMEEIWNALGPPPCGTLPFEPQYLTVEGIDPQTAQEPKIYVTFKYDRIEVQATHNLSQVILVRKDGQWVTFDNLSQGASGAFASSGKELAACYVQCGAAHIGDGSGYGERFDNSYDNVRKAFGLDGLAYPYASGSWNNLIGHCRGDSDVRRAGYRHMYGGLIMVDYLLDKKPNSHKTYDLYKTPHYPFHAVKNGASLFLDFLEDLQFADEVGLVTYDSTSRIETGLDEPNATVDLAGNLITWDYDAIDTIQRHKQAGHYDVYTGLGYGMRDARMLLEEQQRYGSRPTILLMTDGNANRSPSGWSLPGDWNWDELTDYDGDGGADYTTTNQHKAYAFYEAKLAIDQGIKVHTMSVGANADRSLMQGIAFAGGGKHISVPGGNTVAEMEAQLRAAFAEIAAKVPPPKLIHVEE